MEEIIRKNETKPQGKKRGGVGKATWLIFLCWLVYTCSYIGKLSYSANKVPIGEFFQIEEASLLGMVGTFFFFAYGAGQIANGFLCKKYPLKYVVFGALLLSAGVNCAVALTPDFRVIKYLWLVNGVALSVLWPSLIRLLSETLTKKSMGKAVIVMGTSVASGTFLVYGLSAVFVAMGIFKAIFFVAAALLPMVAIVWWLVFNRLVKPLQAETEEETKNELAKVGNTEKKGKTGSGIWTSLVLLAIFAVVTNLVKDGLTEWTPKILGDKYELKQWASILLTLLLPVLAIFGATLVVRIRKILPDFITICAVLFVTALLLIGLVIGFIETPYFVVTIGSFALVSCLMSGVNNVITSMFPLYMKDKLNSGMTAGVLNGFCYIGSMLSSYGLGLVSDAWGWNAVLWTLFGACAFVSLCGGWVYALLRVLQKNKTK